MEGGCGWWRIKGMKMNDVLKLEQFLLKKMLKRKLFGLIKGEEETLKKKRKEKSQQRMRVWIYLLRIFKIKQIGLSYTLSAYKKVC